MRQAIRGGRYVQTLEGQSAFVPSPLPPDPPLDLANEELLTLLSSADQAIGGLHVLGQLVPNIDLFIGMYASKEAVLSSQIEGTRASLMDVLLYEPVGEALRQGKLFAEMATDRRDLTQEITEVLNYVDAMNYGLQRLRELPLSLRLIRELHERLMEGVRGESRRPGQFRDIQNWIGGTGPSIEQASYIPPRPQEMQRCMEQLEEFFYADIQLPVLIKAALIHCQFEMIHPFLDGNGRIGRLLIPLFLQQQGILQEPILYISYFFKKNRAEYYERLLAVSNSGDWEGWLQFFLRGITEVATQAAVTANDIFKLHEGHRQLVKKMRGRRAADLLDHLYQDPAISVSDVASKFGLSYKAANSLVSEFGAAGLLTEMTGRRYNRRYIYDPYVQLFIEGTEPI